MVPRLIMKLAVAEVRHEPGAPQRVVPHPPVAEMDVDMGARGGGRKEGATRMGQWGDPPRRPDPAARRLTGAAMVPRLIMKLAVAEVRHSRYLHGKFIRPPRSTVSPTRKRRPTRWPRGTPRDSQKPDIREVTLIEMEVLEALAQGEPKIPGLKAVLDPSGRPRCPGRGSAAPRRVPPSRPRPRGRREYAAGLHSMPGRIVFP
jgi:hypothetical protein